MYLIVVSGFTYRFDHSLIGIVTDQTLLSRVVVRVNVWCFQLSIILNLLLLSSIGHFFIPVSKRRFSATPFLQLIPLSQRSFFAWPFMSPLRLHDVESTRNEDRRFLAGRIDSRRQL